MRNSFKFDSNFRRLRKREGARGCQVYNQIKNVHLMTTHGDDEHEPDVRERLFYQNK
jgi:hypothetical protein